MESILGSLILINSIARLFVLLNYLFYNLLNTNIERNLRLIYEYITLLFSIAKVIPLISINLIENLIKYEVRKSSYILGRGIEDELSLINLCFKLGFINLRVRKV